MIRDEFDRQAHDILCIVRFGSQGGDIRTEELHKIGDYLRGRKFVKPLPKIEVKQPCKPIVVRLK